MRDFIARYLDPIDRLAEIIYGLLIVMTFTMAFRAFDFRVASNVIAIVMLFIAGYRWAKHAGGKPLWFGLLTAGIDVVLVLVAIPLGG